MSREESNILKYTIAVVSEFASHYGIGQTQAFNYMKRFKELDYNTRQGLGDVNKKMILSADFFLTLQAKNKYWR